MWRTIWVPGSKGRCRDGLRCTAKEKKFKAGVNITGICLGEPHYFIPSVTKCIPFIDTMYVYELLKGVISAGDLCSWHVINTRMVPI